jgi:uncharacterized phage-associated protein
VLISFKSHVNLFLVANVNQVCDYIILTCSDAGEQINLLKLQKLLYYSQAWSLAFTGTPLFDGKFQAWVHGPVNRAIYDRFVGAKTLYSALSKSDIAEGFDPNVLSPDEQLHIQNVLEVYAPFSGSDLEAQAHSEEPWMRARGACLPAERCETDLDENLMMSYYRGRLEKN